MRISIESERIGEVQIYFSHVTTGKPCTTATVTFGDKDGGYVFHGFAQLHPNDHYNKKVGRKLALARALKNAGLTRDEKRQIWEGLFASGMKK